jgi:hypothetical protein
MNIFTILTKAAVIILPFYVFLSVFLTNIIWIPKAGFFIKELLIVMIFFSLIYEFFKAKKLPNFELLDYLVFFYIIYWVWITLYNWLWLNSIIYGWRYDFMFLIVLLIYKHWAEFLKVSVKEILKLFLYSWAWSLLFWFLIKFRFKEEFLVEFWYVDYISNWTFSWWIPIYHWLENSWIRRFQWILDWPNTMWYFLILFSWVFLHLQKKKNEFHVIAVMIFLFWLIMLTYSRSALLWIFTATVFLLLLNIKYIFKKYKKLMVTSTILWLIVISTFWVIFKHQLENIILRTSSTTGHFDRMEIWIERFKTKPMWSWLAESWPGYRNIYPEKQTKWAEAYYIPESWFIQVLTEWWIIFILTFISILLIILKRLYFKSKSLFIATFAIVIMNIFLHIFEATYLSTLTFLIIWLIIAEWKNRKYMYKYN